MTSEQKILVVGASGYVGSRLVPRLLESGYQVRAAGRSLERLQHRPWSRHPMVELVQLDVENNTELSLYCRECKAVYYLVHSMDPAHKDFEEADRGAARNMARAAQEAGIARVIYLSGLGDNKEHLSRHLRSRAEVGEILRSGRVPVTILRAAMIIGTGSASFEILRHLVNRLPIMTTPLWVDTMSQPIAIRNVLDYLVGCLQTPDTAGETYDIGGPEIISYRGLIDMFAEEAHLPKRKIIPLPFLTPSLSVYWIRLVTPIPMALARPLVDGLKNRLVCADQRIRNVIPQRLLSCREAMQMVLRDKPSPNGSANGVWLLPPEWKHPGDPWWVGGQA